MSQKCQLYYDLHCLAIGEHLESFVREPFHSAIVDWIGNSWMEYVSLF